MSKQNKKKILCNKQYKEMNIKKTNIMDIIRIHRKLKTSSENHILTKNAETRQSILNIYNFREEWQCLVLRCGWARTAGGAGLPSRQACHWLPVVASGCQFAREDAEARAAE